MILPRKAAFHMGQRDGKPPRFDLQNRGRPRRGVAQEHPLQVQVGDQMPHGFAIMQPFQIVRPLCITGRAAKPVLENLLSASTSAPGCQKED